MSAPATILVSVEEYLGTDYSPDCDYVEGKLQERNVGEKDHGKVQKALILYWGPREKELGIWVIAEQRLQAAPARFRVPDVCVVAGAEPGEQILTRPPVLCVEILSPEDRISRVQEKIDDYLRFGVRCVWVIDPKTRRGWMYTPDGIAEVRDGVLRAPLGEDRELTVPLGDLFV